MFVKHKSILQNVIRNYLLFLFIQSTKEWLGFLRKLFCFWKSDDVGKSYVSKSFRFTKGQQNSLHNTTHCQISVSFICYILFKVLSSSLRIILFLIKSRQLKKKIMRATFSIEVLKVLCFFNRKIKTIKLVLLKY